VTAGAATVHASCAVVGESGILVRGPAGSGKSTLVRDIVREGARLGRFARLVGDDRVRIGNRNGRVVATAVSPLEGLIEVRGVGLLTLPYETSVIVRCVVDLESEPPRLPEAAALAVSLCGVCLPRIAARAEPGLPASILLRLDHPVTPL
jgi:HPr kinase/phosphorylase